MKIVSKLEFLELPKWTVFQKYSPTVTTTGLSVKQENVGYDDFYYIDLDAVEGLGCTMEKMKKLESGEEFKADYGIERDGMHCPDDLYIVFTRRDVTILISYLVGAPYDD